jgi:S-DNA-T family DNA segregation ATPase FtsK/SpoIIIE
VSSLGAVFHRIVETLTNTVSDPPPELAALPAQAPPATTATALARWLLELLVRELELTPGYVSMPAEVDDLAEALRRFAVHLAGRLDGDARRPAEALADFLAGAELAVDGVVDLGGGVEVRLSGRVDALYAPAGAALEVVEYKLTPESSQPVDQAQVALYRHLLRRARDVDATPVSLRFEPDLTETRLSPAESDALVQDRILPLLADMLHWSQAPEGAPPPASTELCPACPARAACTTTYDDYLPGRDDPPAGAARPRPDAVGELVAVEAEPPPAAAPGDEAGAEEGVALRARVEQLLRHQGVAKPHAKVRVAARVVQVEVSVGRGTVARVDRAAADVIYRLHAEDEREATYARRGGQRAFTIARRQPRDVKLLPLLGQRADWLRERPGRFVVGEAVDGGVLCGDLTDPACCHLLVGGTTGSGKSVLLRAMASSLAHFHAPAAIRFTLVDPKRVSFGALAAGLSAHLENPLCRDVAEALPVLEGLVEEVEERYRLFERASVQDLDEYNERPVESERLARHVVLVDEFQDLVVSKQTREPFLAAVQRLGAKARAAGIHLILATQRPTKEHVPTAVKANLPGQIALRTASALESRIILDQPGAEALLGRGDLLASLGHGLQRGQAALA